jgi:hypothetical protein
MENKQFVVSVIMVALIMIGGMAWYITDSQKPKYTNGPNALDGFAQCLAEKKVTMYGAAWCTHCQSQKKEFGSSFKYVPYVECPDNVKACLNKGVKAYPTWIFPDGTTSVGETSLETIAEKSSCSLPGEDNKTGTSTQSTIISSSTATTTE